MTDERASDYHGWRVVAAGACGIFCATIPLNVFGVFLPILCERFAWSREAASTAFATLTLGAALSAPLVGGLMDRIGVRRVVLCCLTVSGLMVGSLSAMTGSLWHLRAVFGGIGLAMMGASPIAFSRAIFGWFERYRGRALGVMLTGAAISGVVIPPFTQLLLRAYSWRLVWIVLGCITLLTALPLSAAFLREAPTRQGSELDMPAGASVAEALRSRVLWTLIIVVFGGAVATNAAVVHMAALLTDRGVAPEYAALSLSAMAASSLAARLVTGVLLDRFPPVRVSVALLVVAAFGTLLLAGAHSLLVGLLAAACLGAGAGGETDVIPFLLARYFGLRALSTLYGLNWTAWGLAGAAGPIVMGRAFDATGSYTIALLEISGVTLAVAGLMMTLPPVPVKLPVLESA